MYKIIGADGNEYGPVSTEQLKQWMAEGRVNAQTKTLAESTTEWKTLAEFPELTAIPPGPSPAVPPVPPSVLAVPTASPLPADVRERDYDMDIGGCVSRAWQLLTGPKMWLVIGGVAIGMGIQMGMSALMQIPIIGLLFWLAYFVIGGPLIGGVYYFVLRCLRGEAADVGDVFAGFKYRFVQLFLGQLVMTLLIFVAILPGLAFFVAGVITASSHHNPPPSAIALLLTGTLVMLVPTVYLGIGWLFTLPLIMDKGLDFWPAMQLSRQVVGRHWWTTLGLSLLVGILSLVGLFLCCIGLFFTMPLAFVTTMNAYEKMFSLSSTTTSPQPGIGTS